MLQGGLSLLHLHLQAEIVSLEGSKNLYVHLHTVQDVLMDHHIPFRKLCLAFVFEELLGAVQVVLESLH